MGFAVRDGAAASAGAGAGAGAAAGCPVRRGGFPGSHVARVSRGPFAGIGPVARVAGLVLYVFLAAVLCCTAVGLAPGPAFAEDEGEALPSASSSSAETSPSAEPSPSPTSNKPETSPSPSSGTSVNDAQDNTVNVAQLPDNSFLYDTSIAALIEADSYYDNQTVQLKGEAVGDSILEAFDEEHRWVTLASTEVGVNDTLAVYLSAKSCELIDGYGRYGVTGTIIQVRGTFHVACSEHEGATDIHADYVSVVRSSVTHPDAFRFADFLPGLALVLLGVVALLAFRVVRERGR